MAAEQPRVLDAIVDGLRFETLTLSRAEEAYALQVLPIAMTSVSTNFDSFSLVAEERLVWVLQAEAFADEPASAFTLADRAARLEECKRFSGMFTEECAGNGLSVSALRCMHAVRYRDIFEIFNFQRK
eukprot:164544-Rhodomonas_salina.1